MQTPRDSGTEGMVLTCKVILIGDPIVGKTSFVKKYVEGYFRDSYKTTIGVDFSLKVIKWSDDITVKLQLWDIAGQERFTTLTRPYYRNARGCILMFDLTMEETFQDVVKWKNGLDDRCQLEDGSLVPCMLLGNKVDLTSKRVVSQEDIEGLCGRHDFLGWCETSTKDGTMIEEAMKFLIEEMITGFINNMTADFTDSYSQRQNGARTIKLLPDERLEKPKKRFC